MIREWGKVKLDAGIPRGISRLDLHAALCDHAQSAPQRVLWFEHLIHQCHGGDVALRAHQPGIGVFQDHPAA